MNKSLRPFTTFAGHVAKRLTGVIGAAALVSSCTLTSSDTDTNTDTAVVRLQLTDGPIDDALAVNLGITKVIFKIDDDSDDLDNDDDSDDETDNNDPAAETAEDISFDISPPLVVNLLDLQGAKSVALSDNIELPVGEYEEIRLIIDPELTEIVLSGGEVKPLKLPSGRSSGLKVKGDIDVLASGASYTLDFDLRQSIRKKGNDYRLRPVVRLVDNSGVGALSGTITLTENDPVCSGDLSDAAVYLYQGDIDTPDDYGSSIAPFANALISETNQYEFGFIPVGIYTVAVACNAALDDVGDDEQAATDDDITFSDEHKVKIRSGKFSIQNFPDDELDDDDSDEGRDDADDLDDDGNRTEDDDD